MKRNKHLKKIKEYKKSIKLKRFYLVCKKCKRTEVVRTSNPELYTKKLRDNWLCFKCKRNG